MSEFKLKECPFCGGEADFDGEGGEHWVVCANCGARSPQCVTPGGARSAWNTRNGVSSSETLGCDVEGCEDGVVEFLGGDASCVHYLGDDRWTVTLTKWGEMGHHTFDSFQEAATLLREVYGFDDAMVGELFRKTVKWHGESSD